MDALTRTDNRSRCSNNCWNTSWFGRNEDVEFCSVLPALFCSRRHFLHSGRKKDDVVDAIVEEDEVAIFVQVEEDEQEEELVATVPITLLVG